MTESALSPTLKSLASTYGLDPLSEKFAALLDQQDEIKHFRQRFAYPKKKELHMTDKTRSDLNDECVYLCGNSLGLKPLKADSYVQAQLDKWAETAVEMHFHEPLPAAFCDRYGVDQMARLVGSESSSVTLMNGLSINLHLLLISFYQPTNLRYKLLIEKHAFPSDRYAVRSQAMIRGYNPDDAVIELAPRQGEETLRSEDIYKVLREQGSSIAVVCLSGVQYYTGQKFDMEHITKEAQKQGCLVGWDLAHAIGNVRLELDAWGVDFACWCTYKYLNSGPGCIAGAYVNSKHNNRQVPHLHGWWSNREETRFEMPFECDVAPGVDGFRICNPPPVLVSLVVASLEIFEECGMPAILKKQRLLTGYLEMLLTNYFACAQQDGSPPICSIITPKFTDQRGSQLSLVFSISLQKVFVELQKLGVVCDVRQFILQCDVRQPDVMRIAPAPLYNSFMDIFKFISILKEVIKICKED